LGVLLLLLRLLLPCLVGLSLLLGVLLLHAGVLLLL
jgi:hypothetical protein